MKFEINNLAHISRANFNDESDLTVIVGDNGSGKTLFLETLLLVKNEKRKLINNIISNITNEVDEIEISFEDNSDSIVDFFIQEELKNKMREQANNQATNKEKTLNDISNDVSNAFGNDNDNFYEWNGNVKFTLLDSNKFETNINARLDDLETELPKLISREIFFDSDSETEILLSNDRIEINDIYSLKMTFQRIQKIWIFRWVDKSGKENAKISIFRNKESPSNFFKKNLSQILMGYIFEIELGYSVDDKIIMIPTERSQLMLTSNSEFKDFFDSHRKNMRYSESEFLTDFFLNKNTHRRVVENQNIESSDLLDKMIGGEVKFDEDGNILSIEDLAGVEIDRRLFSTKQNRMIPYLMVEETIRGNNVQLIIEEPEANLSLKSIREICDYLIELLSDRTSSVKVILTTHSDVFFQVLNLKLLQHKNLSSKVYEFKTSYKTNGMIKSELYEQPKGVMGYKIDLFGDELEKLFKETIKLEEKINDDSDNEIIISEKDQ